MRPLKVSEVNNYIKKVFATDMILSNVEVEGEISNYNHHYSGHRYFSLKDKDGLIKCVMFKSHGAKLKADLAEGQKVVAKGYISVYEKTGEYQLYIRDVEDVGVGDLYKKFELLKKKLEEEGLFLQELKKELPKFPKKIGIVTAATGAAVKDMIDVITRRYPSCDILIYPSLVQGKEAYKTLIKGVEYLDERKDIDLVIIGRGGGSIDELFAFNDEDLARAIFKCTTPIISAVGHETDFTIADFVADIRAATPSVAAEIAVPNIYDLKDNLENIKRHILSETIKKINFNRSELDGIKKDLKYNNPYFKVQDKRQDLDYLFKDLVLNIEKIINNKKNELNSIDKTLSLLNPSLGLDKGFGILTNNNGKLIKSVNDVKENDELFINLRDGKIESTVKKVERSI